jgi:hypothetical protein
MEERTFDRHDIDHVQSDQTGIEAMSEVERVGLRVAGVLGGIDADQEFLDHRRTFVARNPRYHEPRGFLKRR